MPSYDTVVPTCKHAKPPRRLTVGLTIRTSSSSPRRIGDCPMAKPSAGNTENAKTSIRQSESLRRLMASFSGRARLPPSRDVTIWSQLCRLALPRGADPRDPGEQTGPVGSACGSAGAWPSPPMRPFRGRVSGQDLSTIRRWESGPNAWGRHFQGDRQRRTPANRCLPPACTPVCNNSLLHPNTPIPPSWSSLVLKRVIVDLLDAALNDPPRSIIGRTPARGAIVLVCACGDVLIAFRPPRTPPW